jgi:hypothetical protein
MCSGGLEKLSCEVGGTHFLDLSADEDGIIGGEHFHRCSENRVPLKSQATRPLCGSSSSRCLVLSRTLLTLGILNTPPMFNQKKVGLP